MTMMGWLGVREPLFDEWGNSQILRRPQDDNDGVYALDDAPLFSVILRPPKDLAVLPL